MKKMFFMIAALAMSIAASAQTTRVIKGAVIDKNGNPLPGATVTATGGSEVTTVDADGTFSMEVPVWLKSATAQYAGMANKKMKVGAGDMIFRMRPKESQWFIIANYTRWLGYDRYGGGDGNLGGLMAGRLGKWGWYGKFCLGEANAKDYYYYYDGSTRHDFVGNASFGVTKRIINPLHAYIGFGGGKGFTGSGELIPELGMIYKIKNHFLINLTYQCLLDLDANTAHGISAGFGYAF